MGLLIVGYFALRDHVMSGALAQQPHPGGEASASARGFLSGVTAYAQWLALPVGFVFDTRLPIPLAWGEPVVVLGLGLLLSTVLAGAWGWWSGRPRLAFAALGFVALLAPVSHVVVPLKTLVAERFLYPGLIPLAVGVAAVLLQLRGTRRTVGLAVVGVLAFVAALGTADRVRAWHSDLTLWTAVRANDPTNGTAYYGLAQHFAAKGQLREAESALRSYLEVNATDGKARVQMGDVFEQAARSLILVGPRAAEIESQTDVVAKRREARTVQIGAYRDAIRIFRTYGLVRGRGSPRLREHALTRWMTAAIDLGDFMEARRANDERIRIAGIDARDPEAGDGPRPLGGTARSHHPGVLRPGCDGAGRRGPACAGSGRRCSGTWGSTPGGGPAPATRRWHAWPPTSPRPPAMGRTMRASGGYALTSLERADRADAAAQVRQAARDALPRLAALRGPAMSTAASSWRAFAGLGARILASRASATRPFKVTWMVTDRCDCRCQGCLIWASPKRPEVTPATLERVLRDAPSIRWVNLTGGEVFLRDDVPELARAVKRALPHVAVLDMPTTGQRTDVILGAVEAMAGLGIPRLYLSCSIEGPPELHARLRGRPDAFENLMATYRGLRAMPGVEVFLGMTLNDENATQVEATLDAVRAYVPEVGWDDLHLNVYTVSDHYYANAQADVRAPTAVDTAIRQALRSREGRWDPAHAIEAAYLRLLPEYLRTGRSPLPCQALRANVFVDGAGDVQPCTVYGRTLGSIHEQSLYEILDGAEAVAARDVVARDACPGCWSPCEAHPTIVAQAPGSLLRRPRRG